jgi:uncharacterized protein YecE (DUF72 family)
MYASAYSDQFINALALRLHESGKSRPTWCIFNNTSRGAATANGLSLIEILKTKS